MHDSTTSRDVFKSYLLHDATYAGHLEMPLLEATSSLPSSIMAFSRARATDDDVSGVYIHHYESDDKFQCVWNAPRRYLPLYKRGAGAIGPDFSLYRNMPLAMQQWNCFRGRALSFWLQKQGVCVIPNVRFSDRRSWSFCFDGLPSNATLSVGSLGCLRDREDRYWFEAGLYEMFCALSPKALIVYGARPAQVFDPYQDAGTTIIGFDSLCSQAHRKRGCDGNR